MTCLTWPLPQYLDLTNEVYGGSTNPDTKWYKPVTSCPTTSQNHFVSHNVCVSDWIVFVVFYLLSYFVHLFITTTTFLFCLCIDPFCWQLFSRLLLFCHCIIITFVAFVVAAVTVTSVDVVALIPYCYYPDRRLWFAKPSPTDPMLTRPKHHLAWPHSPQPIH